MKKASILLFIPILLSVFSCSNKNKLSIPTNYEIISYSEPNANDDLSKWMTSVNGDEIVTIMNSNEDFILYIASDGCSHCLEAKPHVLNYVYNSKAQVYLFDTSLYTEPYEEYTKVYSNTLGSIPTSFSTPTVMFYSGRTIVNYVVGATKLQNNTAANNLFNAPTRISNVTLIRDYEKYNQYVSTINDQVIFFFDRNNNVAKDIYLNSIKTKINYSDRKVIMFDITSLDDEEKIDLFTKYQLSNTNPYLFYKNNNEINEAITYNTENDATALISFLNKYC